MSTNKIPVIEDNLTAVTNAMFRFRTQWIGVTDELKESYFFIVNRYLSKIYPEQAFLLNDKLMDKIAGMNIWFAFMKNKPYPSIMWSKSENKTKKTTTEKELEIFQNQLGINDSEMDILLKYHTDEVKEELKYIKSQNINKK